MLAIAPLPAPEQADNTHVAISVASSRELSNVKGFKLNIECKKAPEKQGPFDLNGRGNKKYPKT